jgi:IclR family transcriptional regulator, acetate operon repressor
MFQMVEQAGTVLLETATAIDKALDVLFHLHAHSDPQGVSEIGRALGLPKSSAHRLLAALRRRELVERDDSGRYRPGVALIGLARGMLEREPLVAAARPLLEQQARSLGETFFLVAARGGRLIVLDKAEGTGVLRVAPQVGSAVPVHATAVGRLYMGFAPDAVALERPLARFTRHTIVSVRRLRQQADAARAAGSAVSRGEWQEGLCVFAAPVFERERMLAAVCAAVPSTRLPRVDERAVLQRVTDAAARLGACLGGQRA